MLAINRARQVERRITDINFLLECKLKQNMMVDLIIERKHLDNEIEILRHAIAQDKQFAAFVV